MDNSKNGKSTRALSEDHRAKIKTSCLITRLQKCALGEIEGVTREQIKAAEILLRKTLPDLKQVEHTGTVEGALTVNILRFSDADNTS